jgi:hypothetical protein
MLGLGPAVLHSKVWEICSNSCKNLGRIAGVRLIAPITIIYGFNMYLVKDLYAHEPVTLICRG